MPEADDRYAALEARLAELEVEWRGSRERPLPTPPANLQELRPWLLRLHGAVTDLASDQSDLHGQLGQVVERLEGVFADAHVPDSATLRSAWPPAAPPAGVGKKLLRVGVGVVRRGRALGKRILQSSAPADWIHRVPRSTPPPPLTLAVLSESAMPANQPYGSASPRGPARHHAPAVERIQWTRSTGHYRIEPADGGVIEGQATGFAAVAAASGADVCLWTQGAPLPPELFQAALDLMAIEDLAFLHLRTPHGLALFARWAWLGPDGLDAGRLEAAPRGAVLGKSVGLGGPKPPLPAAAAEKIRLFRGRWLAAKGPKKPIQHGRQLAPGGGAEELPAALFVVLTRALGGGLDRLLADALQGADGPVVLVQLAEEGFAPAHPVSQCRIAPTVTQTIYPLADLFDLDDRPPVVLLLLARHRPRRVLHIGPGAGLFDVAETRQSFAELDSFEHLAVPDPRFPGRAAPPPPSARPFIPAIRSESPAAPLERDAARSRLGLPLDAVVAAHIGDLGFDERPEDVLAAVAGLPADARPWLLLAGRGPLSATVDDLARFYGLPQVLRVDVNAREAIAACDFVVSAAEALPVPWALAAAAAQGKAVVTAQGGPVGDAIAKGAIRVAPGDVGALGRAIGELTADAEKRTCLGEAARGLKLDLTAAFTRD